MSQSWIPTYSQQDVVPPNPKDIIKEHLLDLSRRDLRSLSLNEFSSLLNRFHINVFKPMFNRYTLNSLGLNAEEYILAKSVLIEINNQIPSRLGELDDTDKKIEWRYEVIQKYLNPILLSFLQP